MKLKWINIDSDITTVLTMKSGSYKYTSTCPNSYKSSSVIKCDKLVNGYARITLISTN